MDQAEQRREKLLSYIREKGPITPKQLSEDLGIPYGTLSVDTKILREKGLIQWHLGIHGILEVAPPKEK